MKKRVTSFLLALLMAVTLLGNGPSVYAQTADGPAISAEETTNEMAEDEALLATPSEAEPSEEPEETEEQPEEVVETAETEEQPEEAVETAEKKEETPEEAAPEEPELSETEVPENGMPVATPSELMFRAAPLLTEYRDRNGAAGSLIGDQASWYPYYALTFQEAQFNDVDPLKIRYKDPGYDSPWVYCINAKKKAPDNGPNGTDNPYDVYLFDANDGAWIQNNYFQAPHTGENGFSAAQGVFQALYRGFPHDTLGLKDKYNLSDWELYAATQMAIHFWTDEIYQTHAGPVPWNQNLNKAFFELIDQDPASGEEALGLLRANIFLGKPSTDGTFTQRVMWLDPVDEEEDNPEYEIRFRKVDGSGNPLSDATLIVKNQLTAEMYEWDTDTEAETLSLTPGLYVVSETKAPDGYDKVTDFLFTLSAEGIVSLGYISPEDKVQLEEREITITDKTETHTIDFSKTTIGGIELPGATIQIFKGSDTTGTMVKEWESGNTSHKLQLEAGTYTFHEEAAPDGYLAVTNFTFTVDADGKVELGEIKNGDIVKSEGGKITVTDKSKPQEFSEYEISFLKVDEGGNPLSHATLTVKNQLTAQTYTWNTNAEVHTLTLKPGLYVVSETNAPGGYIKVKDFNFTLGADGVILLGDIAPGDVVKLEGRKITITDKAEPHEEEFGVEFSKVKLGGEELPGAKIEIYKGTDKVDGWESTTDSHTLSLEAGTYRFHEEAAPEGFVAVTDFEFTVEADGSVTLGTIAQGETVVAENGKITVTDNAKKHQVEFSKVKLGGEELPGARIEIYKGDTKIEQWNSLETSTVINLEAGTYRFHEVYAPEGFVAVTDFEFTVEADGSVTLGTIAQGETVVAENGKITVTDNVKKHQVEFSKVKLGGEELPGARIEIYKGDTKIEQWNSLETSTVINLEAGTYRFHEVYAPEGFVAVTDFEFTVKADGSVTLGTIAQGETVVAENGKITVTDNVKKHQVEFSKVKLGGEELPGARIEIYKGDTKIEQWNSLETSTVINLEAGTYRFHEVYAPEGFVAVTDFEFTVKADGSITLGTIAQGETVVAENGKITVTDNAKKHEVEFSKVKLGGEELPGAKIEIYKGTDKVDGWESTTDSHTLSLEAGTYRFHEEAAPEGFVAVTDFEFTVKADGSVTLGTIAQGETVVAENGKITVTDNAKTTPPTPDDEKVEVEFSKVKLGGEELPGAKIEIYKGTDKVDGWESTTDSHTLSLEAGTYRFHEEAAPEGFVAVTDFEFTVKADGSVTLGTIAQGETVVAENGKITVTDNAKTTPPTPDDEKVEVEFSKVKLGGEELPGAKIEIYKGTDKVDGWESTTDSHTLSLEAGTYRFHEEAAPEGFVAVTDFEFTVKADGSVTLGTIAQGETVVAENGKITVTDNAKKHEVEFSKVKLGGEELPGARIEIYKGDTKIEQWNSLETSTVINLEAGTYRFHEVYAPEGFVAV
ncbi:SpaA isopeptide-forming pilin-related protein, partial [Clostridium porci]